MQLVRIGRHETIYDDSDNQREILVRIERRRQLCFEREYYGNRWYKIDMPAQFRRHLRWPGL